MCGRITRTSPAEAIRRRFGIARMTVDDLPPRYNLCPGEDVAAVVSDGSERRLGLLRWGLVPYWTKDPGKARHPINARAETIERTPSFRDAFRGRRCMIVADGFYEWRRDPGGKTPFFLHLRSTEPFALAGIWERWHPPAGPDLLTCAIVTCPPNEMVGRLHDRMPVILPPTAWEPWLDPANRDPEKLRSLLVPYPAAEMEAWPVSRLVNSPRNDVPACAEPAGENHS